MAGILDEFLLIFRPTVQGNGFQQLNRQMKQAHESMFSLKNLFGAFVGFDIYSGIKNAFGSMVQSTRDLGAMRSRFFAITGDMEKANEQLDWAFKLADRAAMPMKALADSYSIFYAATQKGLGDKGAQQVFQDWTEVSRVLHMSEYQFERVTYALREMASKGVVYSQDLRMQIGTHVPNAIGLAEKAVNDLGITGTDWFEKFQTQSKGNQKMINQFLVLFSKYAKEQFASPEAFAKAMQQPDAQLYRLTNQWQKLQYAMVDSGFQDDLLKALLHINNALDKILAHSKEIYGIIKMIIGLVAVLFAWKYFRIAITALRRMSVLLKGLGRGRFLSKGLSTLVKGKGLRAVLKLLGGQALKQFFKLGVKGVLAFIPVIGQVIFVLWTAWDVIQLIWAGLKMFFPEQTRAVKFWILTAWNNFLAFWKNLWGTLVYFFTKGLPDLCRKGWESILGLGRVISDWWNNLPFNRGKGNKVVFSGVTPDKNSWDYIQKQQILNNPLANYGAYSGNNGANNNIAYNANINIDASGLSEEEAADMIASAMDNSHANLIRELNGGVADSKYIS